MTLTCHGESFAPGSVKEPRLKDLFSPSFELWAAPAVSVGATLLTVTAVEATVDPPSLSMIFARTVLLPLSANEQVVVVADVTAP